ncbi:germination protein YpeB [Thermosediminibacter litoriperuensis]|uniref:Germination protein YpeB n=1 Tax=Thermosediminibacter litoriperuensis TaxID=291989 RepID=A0A5S5AW79_9FIRM|nr:germination protein YpeB [Thermosediminibacter litoriperuensis]TYP57599.1 germination protein YpeB [Thermosediminibacter litoriperuensis]
MKNRYVIWGLGILTIVVIALALWSMSSRAYSAENLLEASYQKGFYNLVDDVNTLNILLSKSLVTSSDSQRIMILTSIWHEAENARSSLASLPLGSRDMTNLQKFFAQMGDFSHSLAKKVSLGEQISDKEWNIIEQFKKNTQNLNRSLRELQDNVVKGRIRWERGSFAPGLGGRVQQVMADRFAAIDQRLKEEAPTITYDGPFSDHVEEITPKAITGSPIDEQEAIEKGRKFIDNPANVRYDVSVYGRTRGMVNAYSLKFAKPGAEGAEIVMDVSRQGGHVIWFLNTRDIGEQKIDIETAVDKAHKFLESRGYRNMEPTGSLREDNTVTVTFAYKQGDVLVYPDFVKVEVALDDGQVVGFDAMGYLTHHTTRKIPSTGISERQVRDGLNKRLEVRRIRKVIIPDPAMKERFCYEVDANLDDERYLIYINAQNGREEQVLKVVETDSGTMTM